MINSAAEFVRLRSSDNPADYTRAAEESASDEVWLAVINEYPEHRRWVAHNKTVRGHLLVLLARDDDPEVRRMVASRRAAPAEVLRALASDPDEAVRHRVACNAKAPQTILRRLASDECEFVREAALSRLDERL
jgi:Leucine rich repeat variant